MDEKDRTNVLDWRTGLPKFLYGNVDKIDKQEVSVVSLLKEFKWNQIKVLNDQGMYVNYKDYV